MNDNKVFGMDSKKELAFVASFLSSIRKTVFNPKQLSVTGTDQYPALKTNNGLVVQGLISSVKFLTREYRETAHLLGESAIDSAIVDQWLEYISVKLNKYVLNEKEIPCMLKDLNGWLSDRVYFVGSKLTMADVLMYYALHHIVKDFSFYDKQQLANLSRWFNHMQSFDNIRQSLQKVAFHRMSIY